MISCHTSTISLCKWYAVLSLKLIQGCRKFHGGWPAFYDNDRPVTVAHRTWATQMPEDLLKENLFGENRLYCQVFFPILLCTLWSKENFCRSSRGYSLLSSLLSRYSLLAMSVALCLAWGVKGNKQSTVLVCLYPSPVPGPWPSEVKRAGGRLVPGSLLWKCHHCHQLWLLNSFL
jgi:hypothetical protein